MVPRANADVIAGWRGGRLQVRTTAPPVDERANDAVRRLLARALDVAPSQITFVSGGHGREKVVEISGLTAGEIDRRLARPAGSVPSS